MSVGMWNCYFWPLSASYIYMHCIRCSNETDLLLERPWGYIIRCTWCHTDISLYLPISWGVTLTFLYIFLLLDCFAFALIDCIEKWRAHSELWQFQLGRYIVRCTWCHTDILLYLPIRWGVTLTFSYIFLLLDCFEFALIDCIEKWRVHSELWQFRMGGIWSDVPGVTLTFPYIFLLFDCFEWALIDCIEKWRVHFELWQFRMWGGYCQMYLVSHWHFLISSYYLTVSNGLSLTTLKSEEFTLSSGSFEWGGLIIRFTLNLKIWAVSSFPYIFLLFDCFKWALIDCIEKWRVHSELWQFWMGGG